MYKNELKLLHKLLILIQAEQVQADKRTDSLLKRISQAESENEVRINKQVVIWLLDA